MTRYKLYFTGAGVEDEYEKTVTDPWEALAWVSRMPVFRKWVKEEDEIPEQKE